MFYRIRNLLLLAVFIHIGLAPYAFGITYNITDLGALSSEDYGLNDSEQVISRYNDHAYIWESGSWTTDLGTLYDGEYSYGVAINNSSVAVGSSHLFIDDPYAPTWMDYAFIWDEESGMRDLGYLDVEGKAWAADINNSNQVVGSAGTYGEYSPLHAFLWEEGVGMTDLGTISGSSWSEGYAINNNGYVVGDSDGAFIWDSENGMRDISDLITSNPDGLTLMMANDINDSNQVVGDTYNDRAFLWDDGTLISLGVLSGDIGSESRGINNYGKVIGYSWGGSEARAYVWDSINGMQYLLDLLESNPDGWTSLDYASDINDYGQIVGSGFIDGEMHGFLLTPASGGDPGPDPDPEQPIPEPTSLLLLGFGVVGIAVFRRRLS